MRSTQQQRGSIVALGAASSMWGLKPLVRQVRPFGECSLLPKSFSPWPRPPPSPEVAAARQTSNVLSEAPAGGGSPARGDLW